MERKTVIYSEKDPSKNIYFIKTGGVDITRLKTDSLKDSRKD